MLRLVVLPPEGEGMIGKRMEEALNDQVKEELFSAYLYLSMAAYFSHEGWDGMASWMRIQAEEELGHALRIVDHVLERAVRSSSRPSRPPRGRGTRPSPRFRQPTSTRGTSRGGSTPWSSSPRRRRTPPPRRCSSGL